MSLEGAIVNKEENINRKISKLKSFFQNVLDHDTAHKVAFHVFSKGLKKEFPDIMDKIYLSKKDVENLLQEGHVIGGHTHTHPYLDHRMSLNQAESEISTGLLKLKAMTGTSITDTVFSRP